MDHGYGLANKFLTENDFLTFLLNHKQASGKQQDTGYPDCMHADLHRTDPSGTGADCKDQYDSVVMQCLAERPLLVLPDIDGQALGSAS